MMVSPSKSSELKMAKLNGTAAERSPIWQKLLVLLFTIVLAILFNSYVTRDAGHFQILASPRPASAREALDGIHRAYATGVKQGKYVPFTYPMCTFGACILFIFLLIPSTSRLHNKKSRYLTFLIVTFFYCWVIRNCRAQNVLPGFGIGILSSWAIIWTATILIFHDGKSEYMRIAMLNHGQAKSTPSSNMKLAYVVAKNSIGLLRGAESAQIAVSKAFESSDLVPKPHVEEFTWQSYPEFSFATRLEWATDLLLNARGPGWNWRISHLPQLPPHVRSSLVKNTLPKELEEKDSTQDGRIEYMRNELSDDSRPRSGVVQCDSFWGVILHNLYILAKGFFLLDFLLALGHHDPYFWGIVDPYPPGPSYLPRFVLDSPWLLRAYRLFISLNLISLSVQTVCTFGPLLFVGCFGPRLVGANGTAWLYPDHFGSFQNVLSRGLAGWWGTWWHQNFRYAFNSGGIWMCSLLNIASRSSTGRAVQLFGAFALSGLMHAAGSISMIPETRPWRGAFLFFILQPLGILMEAWWKASLKHLGVQRKIPKLVVYGANFAFVHIWFYYTAPLATDDFARGGVWLYEPFIVSFTRGLGLGGEGDGFFCWKGKWLGWHSDAYKRWWLSGVSF